LCDSSQFIVAGRTVFFRTDSDSLVAIRAICEGASLAKARKKILCIEDDPNSASLIAQELAGRGFEISLADNGSEGFVAILKDKPDLVLCEVGVSIMSGFEVLERLNEIAPRFGHVPFVLLAPLANREHELKARRLGADDYITKPIDFDLLATVINARLAGVARTRVWPTLVKLNDREVAALTWVARGKTSAEIARKLQLAKRTVDFHIDNARIKLRAATRTEAAIKAATGGLIRP
jgi:DNA-binding NarL/FixJ family response regulator